MGADNAIALWSCDGHPEWAARWVLNKDGTLSPAQSKNVVLGDHSGHAELVGPDSPERLIIKNFVGGDSIKGVDGGDFFHAE